MSQIHNPILRYTILDSCLSDSTRNYTKKDLIKIVTRKCEDRGYSGVNERTFWKDIAYLKENFNAPIVLVKSAGKEPYIAYEDKKYSWRNNPISDTEVGQFRQVIDILARLEGLEGFEYMTQILESLNKKFDFKIETEGEKIISFSENKDYAGKKFISDLYRHIKNKTVIKLEYKSFIQLEPETHEVHPYLLKQYNNRWFLVCKNVALPYPVSIYALDRIRKISETTLEYIPSKYENWDDEYFSDFIGTSKNAGDIQEIYIKATELQLNYFLTKPIHETQHIPTIKEGDWNVRIKIIPNHEFYQLMLSFGDAVQIVKPENVKNELVNKIKNALSKY